jgi:uncharacterized protein
MSERLRWRSAGWRIGTAIVWGLAVIASLMPERPVHAQEAIIRERPTRAASSRATVDTKSIAERMNANTLTVVIGNPNLVFSSLGYDLATVLNDGDDLRILPVSSQGALGNVRDVRFLQGIDLGFTLAPILAHYRRTGEIGDINDKIVYIAKICNEEIHVLARSDISSLEQLRGRKVNFSTKGSGNQIAASDIFRSLGVQVEEVNLGPADAMEKLKTGELAAITFTSGKPAPSMASLKASDGFHFVPVPFMRPMQDDYLPSTLTSNDYPNLIPPGQTVDTIAASSILIAFNWPKNSDRYRRVDKFVKAFFSKFAEFQKPPRHPKWRETNLASTLPGWKRFEGAEEWLATYRNNDEATNRRTQFEQFLADRQGAAAGNQAPAESDRNRLFQEFMRWRQSR